MKIKDRIPGLFRSIDNKNMEDFLSFLDEDVSFRFGNMPAVNGRDNVKTAVQGFYDSIAGLSHTLDEVFGEDGLIASNGTVTYTRLDTSKLSVPFATVFRLNGDRIKEYNIYVDISGLYV
jgi:ketosteroid isomerase-like protein